MYAVKTALHEKTLKLEHNKQELLTSPLPNDKSSQPHQTSSSSHNREHMPGRTKTSSSQSFSSPSFSKLLSDHRQNPST